MASQPYRDGQIATNANGETLVYSGGAWHPQAARSSGAPRPIIPLQATPQTPAQDLSSRGSAASGFATAGRTQALTGPEVQGRVLDNQKTQRDLQLPPGMNEATTAQARERALAAVRLLGELNDAEARFRPYEGGTSAGEISGTVLPYTTGLARFRDAGTRMVSSIRQLYRTPDASTTDAEGELYLSMVPSPTERDEVNRDRIDQLRRNLSAAVDSYSALLPQAEQQRIATQREAVRSPLEQTGAGIARAGVQSLRQQAPANAAGGVTSLNVDPGYNPDGQDYDNPGQSELSASQQQTENPQRHQAWLHIRDMLRAGAPDDQVIAEGQRTLGIDPDAWRNSEALVYRRQHGLAAFRRRDMTIPAADYMENRELSPNERAHAGFSQSAGGAFLGHLGNAVTANLVPLMLGGDAESRLAMSREQHPTASFFGDAVGSALPTAGLEFGLARGLAKAGVDLGEQSALRYLPRTLANTTYGATYGAASNPDDPLTGAAVGGMTGAVGGEIGAAGPRALGTLAGGVRAPNARLLADRGVRMTPGQILRDTQGPVGSQAGRAFSGIEQASTSLPIAGDAIADRYADSYWDAQRAAHDEALAPIGQTANRAATTGEELMQSTDAAVGQAYRDALQARSLTPDAGFNRLLDAAEARGTRRGLLKDQRRILQAAFQQVRDLTATGIDGPRYQAAMQIIRDARLAVRDTHLSGPAVSALDRAEAAFRGLARRQEPSVIPALRNADNAYRHASILRDAQQRAINTEDGVVSPGQFGTSIRTQTRRYGGAAQVASTNRPFYELQDAMRNVLPDRLPNSGTAARLGVGAAAAGGGGALDAYGATSGLLPKLAAGLGAVRLAYSGVGRDVMQGALLNRPNFMRRGGDMLQSGVSQNIGAALGRAYSVPVIEDTLEDDPANPNWRARF